ncbi:MAG TPA: rRNA maturation RNase YbeY [Anaerolineae bacterium]
MPTFDVDIQRDVDVAEALVAQLQTAVETTLRQQQVEPPAALSLLLTGDEQIRQLNRDYRGLDQPTDVLSFPAGEALPGMAEAEPYLGDVVISVPYAARQAQAGEHTLAAELQLLAVHGVLHLLGYEDEKPEQRQAMWAAQAAVLAHLGVSITLPTEDEYGG